LGYIDRLPVAEVMSRVVLSLPVHPALSQADLEKIVEVVTQLQSEQVREIEISAGIED
jgi:dTDP-4-amino-4,6-dideoxygalactose transaminase